MYSLAEQPQILIAFLIPCGVLAVPQTPGETWRNCTPDLHIFLNSSRTNPDLQAPLSQRRQRQGCLGPFLAAMHPAYTDGWHTRRGPGLSQCIRIHWHDPSTSWHFSSTEWGGSSSGTVVSALSRGPAGNKYSTLCQVLQSPEDSGWNYISTESIKLYFGPASLSLTFFHLNRKQARIYSKQKNNKTDSLTKNLHIHKIITSFSCESLN